MIPVKECSVFHILRSSRVLSPVFLLCVQAGRSCTSPRRVQKLQQEILFPRNPAISDFTELFNLLTFILV